jgi:hypothetical protein
VDVGANLDRYTHAGTDGDVDRYGYTNGNSNHSDVNANDNCELYAHRSPDVGADVHAYLYADGDSNVDAHPYADGDSNVDAYPYANSDRRHRGTDSDGNSGCSATDADADKSRRAIYANADVYLSAYWNSNRNFYSRACGHANGNLNAGA